MTDHSSQAGLGSFRTRDFPDARPTVAVERDGRTTTLTSGIHDLTVHGAISEPGIVIEAKAGDLIVIPADMVPYVLDAIGRVLA